MKISLISFLFFVYSPFLFDCQFDGCNPIMTAIKMNSIELVKLLMKDRRIDLNATYTGGNSLMQLCINCGRQVRHFALKVNA